MALVGLSFLLCRFVVTCPSWASVLLVAMRDAESRVRFLGYSGRPNAKLFVFTLSADDRRHRRGAVCAPGRHHQSERVLARHKSIEVAIWVAVGGRGTLVGAIARRRFVVNIAKTWFLTGCGPGDCGCSRSAPCSSLVTLFLPKGILGTLTGWSTGVARQLPPLRVGRSRGCRCSTSDSLSDQRWKTVRRGAHCSISTASRSAFDGFKCTQRRCRW